MSDSSAEQCRNIVGSSKLHPCQVPFPLYLEQECYLQFQALALITIVGELYPNSIEESTILKLQNYCSTVEKKWEVVFEPPTLKMAGKT